MTSFPQLLRSRQQGWPSAEFKLKESVDQKIADYVVKDRFHSKTIDLPYSYCHRFIRHHDFVAVLSIHKEDQKMQRLALWSLMTKSKLWDIEIDQKYEVSSSINCMLFDSEMVLVDSHSQNLKVIVKEGKQTGIFYMHCNQSGSNDEFDPENKCEASYNWKSIIPCGNRIFGCWSQRKHPGYGFTDSDMYEKDYFLGEWDHEGTLLNRYTLDKTEGRLSWPIVCNENFWVRLSGCKRGDTGSIIEIYDREQKAFRTFEMPIKQESERFVSACITQNQLYYTKYVISPDQCIYLGRRNPTIGIFDLVKGKVIGEFLNGDENITFQFLVANQQFAAWLEIEGMNNKRVKYFDILNKTVKVAADVSADVSDCIGGIWFETNLVLDITKNLLSIIYPITRNQNGLQSWRKMVVDLASGELKCDVKYHEWPFEKCSCSNGNFLGLDYSYNQGRMYVESFTCEGVISKDSIVRERLKINHTNFEPNDCET